MVRNFYANARIDGRDTALTGGPSRKDGGMSLHVTQRDNGSIIDALTVECYADGDKLTVNVFADGVRVYQRETTR